jgi:uncharacterized membrane protein
MMSTAVDPNVVAVGAPRAIPFAAPLVRAGRYFFAIALVAFGVANFIVGDFVAGRAPAWPSGVGGGQVWAWVSGLLFIMAGLRVMSARHAAQGAVVAAVLIAVWALLRHVPVAAADHTFGGEWTNLGKALALSGGALGVGASTEGIDGTPAWLTPARARLLRTIGRCSLGAFFALAGVQHYMFAQFVQTLVPTWIPGAMFWTYFAGAALIAGGVGLMVPLTARLAALMTGLMVFTWLLVLHIPRGLTMNNQNEWTAVIEALAISGIALSLIGPARRLATSTK